jgi:hypothetical protein
MHTNMYMNVHVGTYLNMKTDQDMDYDGHEHGRDTDVYIDMHLNKNYQFLKYRTVPYTRWS